MKRKFKKYSKVSHPQVHGAQITAPFIKKFDYSERTQDWNRKRLTDNKPVYYINERIQSFCEYLKDLFCIDYEVCLELRPYKNHQSGFTRLYQMLCQVLVGGKDGYRATTIVHEFLHAAGFDHEDSINGYSDFRSNCAHDDYSKLVVRDIFGRDEVLLA